MSNIFLWILVHQNTYNAKGGGGEREEERKGGREGRRERERVAGYPRESFRG